MNTKFSFVLFIVLIALIVTACAPAITDGSAPVAAVPPADSQTSALIPSTGGSKEVTTVRSESQAPRLWSGEVFLSDNGAPDVKQNTDVESACMTVDSQPQRHGGCAQ